MFTRTLPSAVAMVLFLGAGFPVAAQQSASPGERPARIDAYGDPLPENALARLGTLRWRHGAPVAFVAYAENDKLLITASQDGVIHVWEAATGKEVRHFGKKANPGQANQIMINGGNARMIARPVFFGNTITAAALAPDGKTLATCTQGSTLTLWDITTGKEIRTIKPTNIYISGLCFSPDSKQLATRANDQFLRIFDVVEGKETHKLGGPVNGAKHTYLLGSPASPGLAFSADSKTILCGALEREGRNNAWMVKRWDLKEKKELPAIRGPQQNFQALAFSPDATCAAMSANDGTLRIWDLAAGKELKKMGGPQQGGYAQALTLSADGKYLASRGNDQIIRVWDVAEGKELHKLGGPEQMMANGFNRVYGFVISNLAFANAGKFLAYGTNGNTVRQWDVTTAKENERVPGHHGAVTAVAVSADGKTIATQGGSNTVHVWEARTGKELRRFTLPNGINHIAVSANGRVLAASTYDGTVHTWDVSAAKEIKQWKGSQPNRFGQVGLSALALSPDGKTVATRGYDATVRLWDVATARETRQIAELPNQANGNGNVVVFIGGGGINTGTPTMVFSPDGTTLATYSAGQQVFIGAFGGAMQPSQMQNSLQLWDVATGKSVRKIPTANLNVACFAFAPDGRSIAVATHDGKLSLWEVASGKERFHVAGIGNLTALTYSPDGRTLLGGGNDPTVRIWSALTGKLLHQLKGHDGPVTSLALAEDGKTLVSGGTDTTALVWDAGKLAPEPRPVQELNSVTLEAQWEELLSGDARVAYSAIRSLASAPRQVVPAFAERVKPMAPPDAQKVSRLIADLNSNQFQVRQKATDDLEKLGELVEPALKQLLAGQPSLEMRSRAERLLERLVTNQTPPAEELRAMRAVEVLEFLGTPEAREVLEKLAKGAAGSRLTRQAQSSLRRLPKQ